MSYIKDHNCGESDGPFGAPRKLTGSIACQQGCGLAEQQRQQAASNGSILEMLDLVPPWPRRALNAIEVVTGLIAMVASAVFVFKLVLGYGGSTMSAIIWAGIAGVVGGMMGFGLPSLLVALAMTAFFLAVFLVSVAPLIAAIAFVLRLFF